jgi:tRNA-2-methylthio-N6-dimethylallyladenosine synthase
LIWCSGRKAYHKLPEMIARASRAWVDRLETEFETLEKFDASAAENPRSRSGPTAFLSVQEGCDKFCTFCVVPYTRGAELSRPVDDIRWKRAAWPLQGVREITLLGQNVNAYHGAAPALTNGPTGRSDSLSVHIAKIGGIERIRYTTSHPARHG